MTLFRSTGRDFVCSLVGFLLLFAVLTPENNHLHSLSTWTAVAATPVIEMPFAALMAAPFESGGHHFSEFVRAIQIEQQAGSTSQFTMLLAAIVFSAMVAFNLAFFRHLRRVHASSRRGAWRGN